MRLACQHGLFEIVELLLQFGALANWAIDRGDTPLHLACRGGYASICRLLCESGAFVDQPNDREFGNTPLLIAVFADDPDCVKALLDGGASPSLHNRSGITPIQFCKSASPRCASLVLRAMRSG